MRDALELDGDHGELLPHSFARAQVERDAGPSPVIDHELQRGEGLGAGVGGNSALVSIGRRGLAVNFPLPAWPRTATSDSCPAVIGTMPRSTSALRSRADSPWWRAGGSMATSAMSCSR